MRVPRLLWLLALLPLTGCAPAVSLQPGDQAPDPVCARVLQSTPDELAGVERRSTTAQATTAWGDPPITLRCGVEPPGPSTERCLSVQQQDGTTVDWLALESGGASSRQAHGAWTFLTYGREPAIEVVVPVERAGDQPTAVLTELASAALQTQAHRQCVGVADVYGPDGSRTEGTR